MGKKGGWFSAVRKALRSSGSKKKKDKKLHKSNSRISCFGGRKSLDEYLYQTEAAFTNPPPHYLPIKEKKPTKPNNEQIEQAFSAAYAAAIAAEAAARLTPTSRFLGKSKEEIAAIKIQTAYRGYLARKAMWDLRRLGRFKSLLKGQSAKRQTKSTIRCLQTMARVQSQVRTRRIRMSEENQALQRQLLQKHEKELNNIRSSVGNDWDARTISKEQVEASLQSKKEAAERRERALAYAYSHQQAWRKSSKSANPTFMDPNNPRWGWSWLERWMAVRPWETQSAANKESVGDMGRRLSRQLPSTPPSKSSGRLSADVGSKSLNSILSEQSKSSSVKDNESLVSSPSARSHTGSTKSTKGRSRTANHGPSPLGLGKRGSPGTGPGMVGSAKKQISFSGSPGVRKSSGSPRTVS